MTPEQATWPDPLPPSGIRRRCPCGVVFVTTYDQAVHLRALDRQMPKRCDACRQADRARRSGSTT